MPEQIGKLQSYFNFINSWVKTEQTYATLNLNDKKIAQLFKEKCTENSTNQDEIDKLRKRNTILSQDLEAEKSRIVANYCGGLYPTRSCISKYFLFYDEIVVEDSLAYTAELEDVLKKQFMERYLNFHYYILAESVDFLRAGGFKFIRQDWKKEKLGKQSIGDLISKHTWCENKEIAKQSDVRIPLEISRSQVSEFVSRNIVIENLKTSEFPNKKFIVDGIVKLAPIRKANVMSYMSLFNDGWPTSEFVQETYVLKSKFDSFSSLNRILPDRIPESVKLSTILLNLKLPFLEHLHAGDYVEVKKDGEAYRNMRSYFKKLVRRDPLDLKREKSKIILQFRRINKKVSDFNEQYTPKLKRAFVRTMVPIYVCVLGNFLFPPLVVPAFVWSLKETFDFYETLSEVNSQVEKIKRRNSLFSLWTLKEMSKRTSESA